MWCSLPHSESLAQRRSNRGDGKRLHVYIIITTGPQVRNQAFIERIENSNKKNEKAEKARSRGERRNEKGKLKYSETRKYIQTICPRLFNPELHPSPYVDDPSATDARPAGLVCAPDRISSCRCQTSSAHSGFGGMRPIRARRISSLVNESVRKAQSPEDNIS